MKDLNLAYYLRNDFEIDGDLSKDVYKNIPFSPRFVDVIGNTPAIYDTRAAIMWSDDYLYVAYDCESPYPKATMKNKGDLLWFDGNVELFIDGGETYHELQVNAYNTTYEAFYIWRDAYKSNPIYQKQPEFDVVANDARVFGGNHDRTGLDFWKGSHKRGNRWAFLNWELEGLETAVKVNGELNNDDITSTSVTYELKIPWKSLKFLANGRSYPPQSGDVWKMFFARYDNLRLNGEIVSTGWSWDYIGSNDNHRPELFTEITFTKEVAPRK